MDDSLVYRDLLINHVLQPNGYETLVARDGQEGLEIALHQVPDLIITDLRMPRLSGIEVLQGLRQAGRDIPVILMTLHGSEDLVVQAFRLGAKDYVIKPFDPDEMLASMDRALSEARLRQERDALVRDLTEINQQLENKSRQLEAVLTHTDDAILLVGDREILLANQSLRRAFDLPDQIAGRPLDAVLEDEMLLETFYQVQEGNKSAQIEISLSDGRTLNVHITPIPQVGEVAVMQDITHLKELDRLKSEMVSNVSHDLRSPLTSIKGFADLMPLAGPLNDQQLYFLSKVQHGVDNVTAMISDLLDLGRIEAEVWMEMSPCNLQDIAQKAIAGLQSAAELKQQTLSLQSPPDLPEVMGNAIRLSQVLSNLIGNAIKYTPSQGRVTVSMSAHGEQIIVAVQDDGIGISSQDMPHIFEKFYRVKSAATDGIVGTGLGLALVKSIVEKHGGRIWVQSLPGAGSTFSVLLWMADKYPPSARHTAAGPHAANQTVNVLTRETTCPASS